MWIEFRRSILPLQALILGIAINALYLRLFAEYFDGDIFSQLAGGSAFSIDIGFFEPLLFGVFILLMVAAIGALSHYFNRKTILIFTSLVPVCLAIAGFGIIIRFDDISQANWILSLAWILIFVNYCSELAIALCYLLENFDNKMRATYGSLILFAVFLDPIFFMICWLMILFFLALIKGINRLRQRFFHYHLPSFDHFPFSFWQNLFFYLDYSVLFISIYFLINVIFRSMFNIGFLMLLMAIISLLLPFARWVLLKNDQNLDKNVAICLNQIVPIAKVNPLKSLSFVGIIQFAAIVLFFMFAISSHILDQLDGFASNILSQFVNFIVPFAALSLGIITDQLGRKKTLRYSGGLSIFFVIILLACLGFTAFTAMGQESYFIAMMIFLAWLILGGAALAIIPLIFLAENCSKRKRSLLMSIIIALYLGAQLSPYFGSAQLWVMSHLQSPFLLSGVSIILIISAIIGFVSLRQMQETAFMKTENL